jgi:hypothetical protein
MTRVKSRIRLLVSEDLASACLTLWTLSAKQQLPNDQQLSARDANLCWNYINSGCTQIGRTAWYAIRQCRVPAIIVADTARAVSSLVIPAQPELIMLLV